MPGAELGPIIQLQSQNYPHLRGSQPRKVGHVDVANAGAVIAAVGMCADSAVGSLVVATGVVDFVVAAVAAMLMPAGEVAVAPDVAPTIVGVGLDDFVAAAAGYVAMQVVAGAAEDAALAAVVPRAAVVAAVEFPGPFVVLLPVAAAIAVVDDELPGAVRVALG